uniref:Uncharacterized protein n=1 Tax=Anguilla anguilla TaxID=7936 RepID=A0A0E9PDI0_ANGAN
MKLMKIIKRCKNTKEIIFVSQKIMLY